MTTRLKPMQLVWFICISNLTAILAVVILAIRSWHLPEDQHLPVSLRAIGIATIFISLATSLVAELAIQRGLRLNAWTDASLERPRRLVSHPVLTTFVATMIVLSTLYFIFVPLKNSSLGTLFLCLPLSLIRVSNVLRPKEMKTEFSSGSALYPAKPLQSDQWGR